MIIRKSEMSNASFVNGLITGAGIVLAIMSFGFLMYIAPIENQQGVSSTEIRVAIILGGVVAAASIGYEFYTRKVEKKQSKPQIDSETKEDKIDDDSKLQNIKDDLDE